jgi:hypothetical protein
MWQHDLAANAPYHFFDHVLEHGAINREIGDGCVELGVLFAQMPQLADFGRAEGTETLLPDVERRFANLSLRVMSATGVPISAWRRTAAICSSE